MGVSPSFPERDDPGGLALPGSWSHSPTPAWALRDSGTRRQWGDPEAAVALQEVEGDENCPWDSWQHGLTLVRWGTKGGGRQAWGSIGSPGATPLPAGWAGRALSREQRFLGVSPQAALRSLTA